VHPYEQLAWANVFGTLTAIELGANVKHKSFVLMSLTFALHTEHYVRVFDTLVGRPVDNRGRPESDYLDGARHTPKTGYG
jgi:thioester reductase-like protein